MSRSRRPPSEAPPPAAPSPTPAARPRSATTAPPVGPEAVRKRYVHAALQGDLDEASRIVDAALAAGLPVAALYLSVLMPAQAEIGDLWHAGKVSIAEEHLATGITEAQLQRLRERAAPKTTSGRLAVVAAVEGEAHAVGIRAFADLLAMDGWPVHFLGASVPAEDLAEFCRVRAPALVALGATLPSSLIAVRRTTTLLRRLHPAPKILAGGAAFAEVAGPGEAVGADYVTTDALEAVRLARSLTGDGSAEGGLGSYLVELGTRIFELRRDRGLSQQELAERADLDRSYLSAVERGRQNLTIAAIAKLAHALDVPLERLLVGR